jgi:REP element-mobilizing transposase RayT
VEDHVHLLVRMSHDVAPSALMREIKSGSSRWLRAEVGVREFAWQEGYGAFSVSASQADAVKTYIDRQPEHHQRRGFREELLELLDRHGVEYDPRYVLD